MTKTIKATTGKSREILAAGIGLALSSGVGVNMFGSAFQPYVSDWKSDPVRLAKAEEKRQRKLAKHKK